MADLTVTTIAGVNRSTKVRKLNTPLGISDELDEAPNYADFRCDGFTPVCGQEIVVEIDGELEFAGHLISVRQFYEGQKPANVAYVVRAQDYTWQLGFRVVNARYTATSATDIILDLLDRFAPDFTGAGVEAALPDIEEIEFTDEQLPQALTRVMRRVGGYWRPDYDHDILAFTEDTVDTPDDLDNSNTDFADFSKETAFGQYRNRVLCEGGGSPTPIEVTAGLTKLPVTDGSWYPASGQVKAGSQRIAYAAVVAGGSGAMIGTGVIAPSNAATGTPAIGTGLDDDDYKYKTSFVTGAGETLTGPASVEVSGGDLGEVSPPTSPTGVTEHTGGSLVDGGVYHWKVTYVDSQGGETTPSSASAAAFPSGGDLSGAMFIPVSADPNVVSRKLYRHANGGSTYKLAATIGDNTTTDVQDGVADGSLGADAPSTNTAVYRRINLTNIPISPDAAVTGRKVYRTEGGGSTFKLLTTIANNTATTYADSTADGSLGATEPATDTSGLSGADGHVNAGSTTVPSSSTTPFESAGGYARIGSQVIRYTGKTSTTVTGVPASGLGSLLATVRYGQEILALPMLTGIAASGDGSILYDLIQGSEVNVLAQADDTTAQTALAALVGGDGVVEHIIKDNRLSYTSALERAEADLLLFKAGITTIRYTTRDPKTKAGKTVTVNLSAPTSVAGDFKIQRVAIAEIDTAPNTAPLRSVEASSIRFSMEDVLRRTQLTS